MLFHILHAGPTLGSAGPNFEHFRSAQVPSQLAPRSVELGAWPNWDQLVQLADAGPFFYLLNVWMKPTD